MYKRRTDTKRITQIVLISMIVGFIVIYISGILFYRKHVFANTKFGEIKISNCSAGKVEKLLNSRLNDYKLTIKARDSVTEVIAGNDVGLEYDINDFGKKIISEQNPFLWVTSNIRKREIPSEEFNVKYDETKFQAAVAGLSILQSSNIVKPVDAHITEYISGEGFKIVKETVGNELDVPKFVSLISNSMKNLEEIVELEEKDVYINPSVYSHNKKLNKKLDYLNTFVSTKISYTFGEDKFVIDGDTVHEWMKIKKNGKVEIMEDKVKEFVNRIGAKYDTIFRSRTFKTHYGNEITIEGGDYGWWMNRSKETETIIELIKKGEVVEREPEYFQKAEAYGKKDYGDSYVEINLTAQHLFVYKKGKVVLESDFVSGKDTADRRTPTGVYGVTYKERDATLVGEDYETPVSYWMPFNGSVGMHDAIWRTKFGSNLYKAGGSHGCINLPFYTAEKIYGLIEKGYPVIVYEMPGTQSMHVTMQSDEEIAHFVVDAIDRIGSIEKGRIPILEKTLKRIEDCYKDLSYNQRRYVSNYNKYQKAVSDFKKLKQS